MTFDNILVLIILIGSIALFVFEKLRADVVALLVLLSLIVTGLLTVEQALQGFASPAVVTVWAVFIISAGLQRSGIADILARQLLRLAGNSETRLIFFLMVTSGLMSAFMNNIGAVAILMPAVISIGRKLKISPSKLLIPLAFAALLGGNMTLIGTPPNILASDIMSAYGVEPFGFFDFLPTGILVLTVGIVYMMLVGRKLIPERIPASGFVQEYHVRDYLTEVKIAPQSLLAGKRVNETDLGSRYNLNIVYVHTSEQEQMNSTNEGLSNVADVLLEIGDTLLLEGKPQDIVNASETYRLLSSADFSMKDWPKMTDDELHLAQITLGPQSTLAGRTLKEIDFRDRYGLSVLAIRHDGTDQTTQLSELPIRFGDSLLVQGSMEKFNNLVNDDFLVLESPNIEKRRTRKIPLASGILLGVVVMAVFGWPVAAVMLGGALLMVIGKVLNMDEAYQAIDWKAVFLIAGMLPLGIAMDVTGTAQLIANQLIILTGGLGAVAVLCTIFILTALLTEVISNAAAAVLVIPIVIDVAFSLNLNAQPFVMGTVIAASTSFLMPIGHQVNVIIYGAGGYKFSDYARVGLGLNLLLLLVVAIFVPLIWPF